MGLWTWLDLVAGWISISFLLYLLCDYDAFSQAHLAFVSKAKVEEHHHLPDRVALRTEYTVLSTPCLAIKKAQMIYSYTDSHRID